MNRKNSACAGVVFAAGAVLSLFAILPGAAHGAFFQLTENSPTGIGNAFAGGSAIAEDPSTVWYNPAGLTRLGGSQYVAGGHLIMPSVKFTNAGSSTALGQPLTGGNGGDAGENAFVPNFYMSRPIDDRTTFGLGVNVPFGLTTDYDADWVGRYHAIRSEVQTINVNPAIGRKINEQISIGAGINVQRIEAELTQAIDFGTICAASFAPGPCPFGLTPQQSDGLAKVTADDTSFGYNIGVLWQATASTRAGLHYRSAIDYELEGDNRVTTPSPGAAQFAGAANIVDSNARADVTLPATISLSAFHALSPRWAIMGDITQTRWSRLPELRIRFDSGQADSVVTLDLEDVYRYSLGATYTPGGPWTFRGGIALDQTPTPNASARSPRLPDADRKWLAFGADYQQSDTLRLGFAYAYLKLDDAQINKATGSSPTTDEDFFRGNLVGSYKSHANIVSVQALWKF